MDRAAQLGADAVVETERLLLRPLTPADRGDLCEILQDKETMYAYEHAFSDEEVDQWLQNQLRRYREEGFGLWAAVDRESGEMVGQIGLTLQDWDGRKVPEVGYLLKRRFWGIGYATEGARGCMDYAFERLGLLWVCSIIRDNNLPSQRVARRNGLTPRGHLVKHYYDMDMPHTVWCAWRPGGEELP